MALTLYQLLTALILIAVGLVLLGWRVGKERTRPEAITTIGALCLICAVSFLVSRALTAQSEAPSTVENIAYTMRGIPYDAGLIALSYFVIRSIGYKYPRTQVVLSFAPTVFGLCWISAFASAFIVDVPVFSEYSHFPPEFLLLKFRNIPELVWPALAAVVFARELLPGGAPSLRLRAQHTSFLVACLGFVVLSAAANYVNYLKVFADQSVATDTQVSAMLSLETVALAIAMLGWISGAILDDSSEDADRLADEVENWIERRHDTEMMIDQQVGHMLSGGRGVVGNDYITNLYDQAYKNLGDVSSNEEDGEKLLQLLWIMWVNRGRSRRNILRRLRTSQRELSAKSNVRSRLLVKLESNVRYDIASDPLFKAIGPALELEERDAVSRKFHRWQPEHQLALYIAADIGLISSEALNKAIMSNPAQYITLWVINAYGRAKNEQKSG